MKPIDHNPEKNTISDDDLLLVYFNEANQTICDAVAKDSSAQQRLEQLEVEMKIIGTTQSDESNQPELPADYGQDLWLQIEDQLVSEDTRSETVKEPKTHTWLQQLLTSLTKPQYSMASMVLVAGLVMIAFYAGQNNQTVNAQSGLQEQLLAQNIQLHLTQSEIFLTNLSNGNGAFYKPQTAQRLLASNRIFKQALTNHEGQYTQQLLSELEPILLEYANSTAADQQTHGQPPQATWISDTKPTGLMFQIKAMKQQLAQKNDII